MNRLLSFILFLPLVASAASLTLNPTGFSSDNGTFGVKPWIDVTLYGADSTGVTDSTTAIQNAINAMASGNTLYIPAGTFLVTSLTFNPVSDCQLLCDGTLTSGTGYLVAAWGIFDGSTKVPTDLNNANVRSISVMSKILDEP